VEDATGEVMGLRGVSFAWETEEYPETGLDGGKHYGVVAEKVEAVLPDVVGQGVAGDRFVSCSDIIPVLVESMKQPKSVNEGLKDRIAAIEARIDG
jgi:hypothetical protein